MKKFVIKTYRRRKVLSLVLALLLLACAALPPMEGNAAQTDMKEESLKEEVPDLVPEGPGLTDEDRAADTKEEADPPDAEEEKEVKDGEDPASGEEKEEEVPDDQTRETSVETDPETGMGEPDPEDDGTEETPEDPSGETEEEDTLMKAGLLSASSGGSIPSPLGNVTVGRQGRTALPVESKYVPYTRCWYVIHNGVKYWAVCARASASGAVPPESPDSKTASCRYNVLNETVVNGISAWQKAGEIGSTVPITKNLGYNAELAKAVLVSMFTRAEIWEESFSSFSLSYAAAHLLVSDLLFGDDDAASGENYDLVFHQMKSRVENWMQDPMNKALMDSCSAYIAYKWDGGVARGKQSVVWVEGLPGVMDLHKSAEDQDGNPAPGQDLTGTTYVLYKDRECRETAKDIFGRDAVFVCDSRGEAEQIVLPIGTYYLKETKAASGMNLDEEVYTAELVRTTSFGDSINFLMNEVSDSIKETIGGEGSLVIEKRDSETGSARGGASLEGAVYDLIVDQEEGVADETGYYEKGQVYDSLKTDAQGKASLENIPEGAYILKEKSPSKGYKITGGERSVLIEKGKTLSLTGDEALPEDIIRAPFRFEKKGSDDGKMAGVVFRITCRESGESWEVTTGEDGIYDSLNEKDPARARIVYGTYLVEELPCPANEGFALCEKVTFSVGSEKPLDLGTFVNYRGPSAATSLTDEKGNRYLKTAGRITLTDTVTLRDMYDYKGKEIRLRGILVDTETGKEVCGAEKNLTLESAGQTVTMDFVLDASDLGGKSLAAFEYVYDSEGSLIAKHEDINDSLQTVHFPALQTLAVCESTGDHVLPSSGHALVRDTVSYRALEGGKTYRIDGILYDAESGKPFLAGGKEVKSSVTFTADASGKGTVTADFSFDMPEDAGGRILVAAETLFDSEGAAAAEHKDLKDKKQTLYVPSIGTSAQDLLTGDHQGTASGKTTLRDRVDYSGLSADAEYEVFGTLMVRETGEPLYVNGEKVTATRTFVPEKESGFVCLDFTFDASALAGEAVVVFEELYHKDIPVAAHADLRDAEQTIVYPGIRTSACDIKTGDHLGSSLMDRLTGQSEETKVTDRALMSGIVPGYAYRVKGILCDKETGEALKGKDGKEITAESEFTASSDTETAELTFTVDVPVSGKSLVVCEDLIHNDVIIASHKDLSDEDQTIHYPRISTSAEDTATDSRTGALTEKAVIKDRVFYDNLIPSSNENPSSYTVKGTLMRKGTGEKLLDREGREITAQVTFSPENPSGSVDLTFAFDASLLEGETVVCFERLYREDILVAVHADLEDRDQSIFYPSITTRAADDRTGTQIGSHGEEQSLTDMVAYRNLLPGTYVVKGVLTDSESGLPFPDADGKEIMAEKTFTASEMNGEVPVTFRFRAQGLSGRTLTVFETLYTEDGTVLAVHEDREDRNQMIFYPGITTEAEDDETHTHTGPVKESVTVTDHVFYTNLIPSAEDAPREYTIRGTLMVRSTGEMLLDENGEPVTAETVFSPEKADGCEDLVFTFSSALLKGETVVCFETLYEKDIEVAVHADLEDDEQSIHYPSIRTSASAGGKKTASAKGKVTLEDLVEYRNLVPGTEYELTGILMDKKTGKPLTAGGKEVKASALFVPEEENGSVTVTFVFDASGLGDRTLVAFETLLVSGIEAASHKDLEDEGQSVHLTTPPSSPKTGDESGAALWALMAGAAFAGAAALVLVRRRIRR